MNRVTGLLIILSLLLIAALSEGCKTRSYLKTSVSTSTKTSSEVKRDSTGTTVAKLVDTTSTIHTANTVTKDSSETKTTFTPIPGTTTIIRPDGTIEGQFTNIQTDQHKKSSSTRRDTTHQKKAITNITQSSTHLISDNKQQTKATKDSTYKKGNSDSTLKANIPTGVWIGFGILLLGVIAYIIYRVRSSKII